MNTYKFKSRYGTEYEIRFIKARYMYGGSLAIKVEDFEPDGEWWEPYATLTVNIDDFPYKRCAYLDSNNVPDLCEFVLEKGWAKEVGCGRSGYCTYPMVAFTDEFLNDVCEEE